MATPSRWGCRKGDGRELGLLQLRHRRQDVLVRGPDPKIDLKEPPTHDSLLVDNERGGMWDRTPLRVIGVEKPVTVDDRVVQVLQQLKLDEPTILLGDPVDHHLLFIVVIHRYGKDLRVGSLLR